MADPVNNAKGLRSKAPSRRSPIPPLADLIATERRASGRIRTIFRVAEVRSRDETALCRIRNISDGGMMLNVDMPIHVGEPLHVKLSDELTVAGRVVWTTGDLCGIDFYEKIDAASALRAVCEEQRSETFRRPRLRMDVPGVAYTEQGIHPVRATDLSQHGIGIEHHGGFRPGMRVLVMLENGLERRCIVRWSYPRRAGLSLNEPLTCSQLNGYLGRQQG